jgi:hypothetical protein
MLIKKLMCLQRTPDSSFLTINIPEEINWLCYSKCRGHFLVAANILIVQP